MKFYVVFLFFLSTLLSCSNDDNQSQDSNLSYNGLWHLVKISGGPENVDLNYERGHIIWDIDTSVLELDVINNNPETISFDGPPTGNFDYRPLTTTGEVGYFVIDVHNISHMIVSVTETEFILDEALYSGDGFILTFKR